MTTSRSTSGRVHPVLSTRTNHPNQPIIRGCYQRNLGDLHLDHAINFMDTNWLVLVGTYSTYPCIHATGLASTKATVDLQEQEFAHFGYPYTLVTENTPTSTSDICKERCRKQGITHLSGAPYHPATNRAADRLV